MATLKVNRGTTFTIGFQYMRNGVPASLVGATIYFTVKNREWDDDTDDTDAVLKKTVTSHIDPTEGTSEVIILPTDTADIDPLKYYYDLKVKEADGSVYKVDEGRFALDGSPTNRSA